MSTFYWSLETFVCVGVSLSIVLLQENHDDPLLASAQAIISQEENNNSYITDSGHTGTLIVKIIISIVIRIIIIILIIFNIINILVSIIMIKIIQQQEIQQFSFGEIGVLVIFQL